MRHSIAVLFALCAITVQAQTTAGIRGTITDVNKSLEDNPETINTDPYNKGWLIKIKIADAAEANSLMDSAAYIAFCANR